MSAPASAAPRPGQTALKLALGGAVALAAGHGVGRFLYTPILPEMASALALPPSQTGLIAAANYLGYLVGALLAATPLLPGAGGAGRRVWLLAAIALSAGTTGAMAFVETLPAFLALRGLGGVASAFILVFASALVMEAAERAGRPGLVALFYGGVGAGVAASALVLSGLSEAGADWRGLWLAGAAATGVALAGVASLLPAAPARNAGHGAASVVRGDGASPRPDRFGAAARLALAYGLFGFGYVVTATFIVAIAAASPEAAPIRPWIWALVGLAAAPSVWPALALGRRLGLARAFAVGCGIEAVGVALSSLWPTVAGLALAALLLGATYMGLTALGLACGRALGTEPRRALALMTASFGIGQTLGPAVAGALADRFGGYGPGSLAAVACLAAAASLTWRLTPRGGAGAASG